MTFYYIVIFLTAAIELYVAGYVLSVNPRGMQNRLLSAACLSLALSAVFWVIMASLPDPSELWFWYSIASICWLIPTPLIVHFMLALSRRERLLKSGLFLTLLYGPTLLFIVRTAMGVFLATGFTMTSFGWMPIISFDNPWNIGYGIYTGVFCVAGLLSVHLWGVHAPYRTQRIQARIICYSGFVTLAIGFSLVRLGQLAELFWIAMIGLAAVRFNLMSPTLVSAAGDILRAMSEGIILIGWDSRIIDVNEKTTKITGFGRDEMIGMAIADLLPQVTPIMETAARQLSAGTAVSSYEIPFLDPAGKEIHLSLSASPVIDRFGESVGAVVLMRDISELKQAEERLKFMATHDPLTNLPNRFLLNDRLRMGIAQTHRSGLSLGVMLIDLDNFKSVNDTFGHETGDKLLRLYAERLSRCLRANDSLARMGGDEFVVLLAELKQPGDQEVVARRILTAVREPFTIDGLELSVTSSIGISVYPRDADSMEGLLRAADLAMYTIKSSGRNDFRCHSESFTYDGNEAEYVNAQSLEKALDGNQFELYYQPIHDVESDTVLFAEALLRWNHPTGGLLTAGTFIDTAEKTGLSIPIGEWVLKRACAQLRAWTDAGTEVCPIAVNISARHFQSDGFIQNVKSVIRDSHLDNGRLLLELTESTALRNMEKTRETVERLTELGIRIIMDDFGAGFSFLHWMKSMPIYALKIDRALIQHIEGDVNNMTIVRAMISLAHGLGIRVIAGGVETREQVDALSRIDTWVQPSSRCDGVQGFFLDHPMPVHLFEEKIFRPISGNSPRPA